MVAVTTVVSKKRTSVVFYMLLSSVFIHRKVQMWRPQREAGWGAREPSKRKNEWVVVLFVDEIRRDSSDYSMRKNPKHISVGWCRFGHTPSLHGFKGATYKIPLIRLQKKQILYVHKLVTEWHTESKVSSHVLCACSSPAPCLPARPAVCSRTCIQISFSSLLLEPVAPSPPLSIPINNKEQMMLTITWPVK